MAITEVRFVFASSAGFWLLASLVVGGVANRLPPHWLTPRTTQTLKDQPRPVAPAGIRHWKRWIPDAGNALPGGILKASLVQRDPASLERLVVETCRAELVHWMLWSAAFFTILWLPPPAIFGNLIFATVFNAPCLALQRYTRQRLRHCLSIASRRDHQPNNSTRLY